MYIINGEKDTRKEDLIKQNKVQLAQHFILSSTEKGKEIIELKKDQHFILSNWLHYSRACDL
ncbi:hypothetical protein RHGRI_004775 [Rhododendron griersonianum]|uniref:Uncharacterized protein n=1 Tax=Rhododendron griersonianum TaxID=479676 RepID=A0AAV6LAX7_9ERIC|nr:hypothetical protein RHGRI_004775 [Rhododendron griersonianum]